MYRFSFPRAKVEKKVHKTKIVTIKRLKLQKILFLYE